MNTRKKHKQNKKTLFHEQLESDSYTDHSWNELVKLESLKKIVSGNSSILKSGNSAISSALWDIANKRRDELMRIESQKQLTPSEAIELKGLQELAASIIRWFVHCMICNKKKQTCKPL